jgi:voltage-gated potassium channel
MSYIIFKQSRLIVMFLLLAMLGLGTGGYVLIEGWSFTDALYMTIITMTTIGYGETQPLSPVGRWFTIGLIMFGVVIASYTVGAVIELFTSAEFRSHLHIQRRRKLMQNITHHCLICGFGRMGRSLGHELKRRGAPFIVIDQNTDVIERCHQLGYPAILGNAADERILGEAGIERAESLVAAANSDAENVFIVLTAKSLNPRLRIIARCNSEASIPKLETAGAHTVISPYSLAGRRIAQTLTHPNVMSFLDGMLDFGDHQMRLEEFIISPTSPLAGLTLRQAQLNAAVLAIAYPEQTLLTHPKADDILAPGAAIIVMGLEQELAKLAKLFKEQSNQ